MDAPRKPELTARNTPLSNHRVQRTAAVSVLLGLSWCAAWAFRTWRAAVDENLALKEAQTSPLRAVPEFTRAAHWRPDNANIWEQMATYSEFEEPSSAKADALRAIRLDPRDRQAWQALAMANLQLGDLGSSRRDLAEAGRFDQGFQSHFELGNLSLALGDRAAFVREMAAALKVAPPARLDLVIDALENHGGLRPASFAKLLPAKRAETVARAVIRLVDLGDLRTALAAWSRLSCAPYQYVYCKGAALTLTNALLSATFAEPGPGAEPPDPKGHAIDRGEELTSQAISVWNRAVSQGFLNGDPARTGAVPDGSFEHPWQGEGFSWRNWKGVPTQLEPRAAPNGNAVLFSFNGFQADGAVLMTQFVPVQPGAPYELRYLSREAGGGAPGLFARVLASPQRALTEVPAASGSEWSAATGDFTVPTSAHLVELAFVYRRPLGQTRMRSPAEVAHVSIRAVSK